MVEIEGTKVVVARGHPGSIHQADRATRGHVDGVVDVDAVVGRQGQLLGPTPSHRIVDVDVAARACSTGAAHDRDVVGT